MEKKDTETQKQSQYQPNVDQETDLPNMQKNSIEHEIEIVNEITKIAFDELKITVLLAHTLAENAIKAMRQIELESNQEPLNAQEVAGWEKYTNEINQILDQFGMNLQEILNQNLGQEVIEEAVLKYKTKMKSLKERRH